MYHAGTAAAPNVAAKVVSSMSQAVQAMLKAQVPWNSKTTGRRKWIAILNHEMSAPTYRGMVIPIPSQDAVLCYNGEADSSIGTNPDTPANQLIRKCGDSSCVLRFALLSKKAGWNQNEK